MEKTTYTVSEVVRILKISRPTLYKLLDKHLFYYVKVGKIIRIEKESFDEWLCSV